MRCYRCNPLGHVLEHAPGADLALPCLASLLEFVRCPGYSPDFARKSPRSVLVYTLMKALRRLGLQCTQLVRAPCLNLRVKLIEVGAVVLRNTRAVYFHISESYPYEHLITLVAPFLVPTWQYPIRSPRWRECSGRLGSTATMAERG